MRYLNKNEKSKIYNFGWLSFGLILYTILIVIINVRLEVYSTLKYIWNMILIT